MTQDDEKPLRFQKLIEALASWDAACMTGQYKNGHQIYQGLGAHLQDHVQEIREAAMQADEYIHQCLQNNPVQRRRPDPGHLVAGHGRTAGAYPATGAMEERATALAGMPGRYGANQGDYVLSHWYDVHFETIRTALTTSITQPSAGDVEKVRSALSDMRNRTKNIPESRFRSRAYFEAFYDAWCAAGEALAILDTLFPKVGA